MATMPPATGPEDGQSSVTATSAVDEQTINVQVLSPSNGVTGPLLFPGLAANTTVKQLKDKIRQSLPLRPADENQRLIHRGRAIVRESDTLLDIFGADAVRNPEQHTIHLVIRDVHDSQTSASTAPSAPPNLAAPGPAPAPARGPSPTASAPPTNPPRAQPPFHGQPFGYQVPWRNSMPPTSNPFPQPRMPSPSPTHTPEQAAAFQHQHQNMTQWLTNIQREAMARALNQNQRTRAQMGMRGVGDNGAGAVPTSERSGRASPAPGQTIYREHVGPNGHTTYQVQTFTSSGGNGQQGHGSAAVSMSPADVHNIIRSADVNQATSAATSAMQRSASSTSLHNRPLAQPGMTAPVYPYGYSAMSSRRGTPEPASNRLAPTAASGSSQSRQGPEVYILSSPEGPRALLFNNTSSEAYYTPRLRTQTSLPQLRQTMLNPLQESFNAQMRHRHHHHHHHHPRPQVPMQQHLGQMPPQAQPQYPQGFRPLVQQPMPQQEPAAQGQAPVQAQAQAQGQGQVQNQGQEPEPGAFMGPLMHRGNPPMGALPPLLIQLWPQIWLLFRLALFVWFFTSPNASWSRWFTIIVVAVFIFVLSTGVLNGVPDHVWRPLGRHLENLIPLDPRGRGAAAPEQRNQQNPQPRQDPDPTEMARRLVAQHQGQENWVVSQVRRLERAGLLFLASIAPGVAERHIANLEAAARAERERIEAEAREAEAAAAAQNDENNETQAGDGDEATTTGIEADQVERAPEDREGPPAEQGVQEENQHDERQPLIQL
ncbi:hypothetical protein NW752_005541 [Fusarium irregulare]|uniref:Ubiquitin-like domain-containing protein n=1 Tax=Fusarium irregulare TaxID=2494466 RepID=A0A9W8UAG6_9HYPO|nr:hypothetical protein NW766_006070 [Fusarium irregulare]KAJ4018424.1 hypothetical protein NW752_005541 [Fusarium irregulare]